MKDERQEEFSGSALEWDGSDNYHVVNGSKCSSDERPHPEDPLKHAANISYALQLLIYNHMSTHPEVNECKLGTGSSSVQINWRISS
jgi:hypothetical protein